MPAVVEKNVRIVSFIKHTVAFGHTDYDITLNPEIAKGVEAADKFEEYVKSSGAYESVRELELALEAIDTERVSILTVEDTTLRQTFEDSGAVIPEDAAIMFLRVYARELGRAFIGTLMVRYNSELEL